VQFLLRRDRRAVFSFAALQGGTAAAIRSRHPLLEGADSMVLVRDAGGAGEQVLVRSTAALYALAALGGVWRVVSWVRILPRPLRDAVYDAIAKRRYRWFGKFDSCRLPAAGDAARFLP
jgi:predicted DCC family thiol-disulfide oxidoreductase YuxK